MSIRLVKQDHIRLTLPDGTVKEVPGGTTGLDLARSIGKRLASDALAISLDGRVLDLPSPIPCSGSVKILTFNDPDGRAIYRHSCGHVMAQAVMDLFPGAEPAAGDWSDERYFYDFRMDRPFTEPEH